CCVAIMVALGFGGAAAISGAGTVAVAAAIAVAAAGACAIGVGPVACNIPCLRVRQAKFLLVFALIALLLCPLAARLLSPFDSWRVGGPLFLFLVLLTLINAPFDWISVGLTRVLLRLGIDRRWPYPYALLD